MKSTPQPPPSSPASSSSTGVVAVTSSSNVATASTDTTTVMTYKHPIHHTGHKKSGTCWMAPKEDMTIIDVDFVEESCVRGGYHHQTMLLRAGGQVDAKFLHDNYQHVKNINKLGLSLDIQGDSLADIALKTSTHHERKHNNNHTFQMNTCNRDFVVYEFGGNNPLSLVKGTLYIHYKKNDNPTTTTTSTTTTTTPPPPAATTTTNIAAPTATATTTKNDSSSTEPIKRLPSPPSRESSNDVLLQQQMSSLTTEPSPSLRDDGDENTTTTTPHYVVYIGSNKKPKQCTYHYMYKLNTNIKTDFEKYLVDISSTPDDGTTTNNNKIDTMTLSDISTLSNDDIVNLSELQWSFFPKPLLEQLSEEQVQLIPTVHLHVFLNTNVPQDPKCPLQQRINNEGAITNSDNTPNEVYLFTEPIPGETIEHWQVRTQPLTDTAREWLSEKQQIHTQIDVWNILSKNQGYVPYYQHEKFHFYVGELVLVERSNGSLTFGRIISNSHGVIITDWKQDEFQSWMDENILLDHYEPWTLCPKRTLSNELTIEEIQDQGMDEHYAEAVQRRLSEIGKWIPQY